MNVYAKEPTVESNSTKFGFYPKYLDIKTDFFSVITIPEYKSVINDIKAHPNVDKDWFYAGSQKVKDLYGNVSTKPYSNRVFSLPNTHILTLNGAFSQEDLNFVIWCLSFFTGMRLTTTQAGFLDATPIKPGALVDFVVSDSSEQNAIQVALNYLKKENHHPRECTRIAAVIHALFLAQRPQLLHFEKFQYLYMALDGCFSIMWDRRDITKKHEKPKHIDRVKWMCKQFEMHPPFWADGKDSITPIRNDSFHEAIFFDQPLGFSAYGTERSSSEHDNILLQIKALIYRFLVAILEVKDASYISSSLNSRAYYQLKIGDFLSY
ncbi:hypothetical protein [Providencia sp. PROV236]|uniref:hypothetical protein n=1 Tax=Providencia sp. PROV236 TaxID=2936798 RepID=UPI0034E29CEA